jgi:predicted DNA-binding transcriptional regulator YafY
MEKPPRKSAKDQTIDYLHILGKLSLKSWRSCRDIRRSLTDDGVDISKQKLQRALKAMRDIPAFDIEVTDRSIPYGYRLGKNSPFAQREFSPQEILLLSLSHAYLRFQLPAKCLESLEQFFDQAERQLKSRTQLKSVSSWGRKVAVVPNQLPFIPPRITNAILKEVTDALYSDKVLTLTYQASESTGKSKGRISVLPLGLVQQDVRIYLVCQYEGSGEFRHLALHRIQKAKMTDRCFVPPEGFDLDEYIKERHFNYSRGEGRVRLSFETVDEKTVRNLAETPFNKSQVIEEIGEGRWRVTAEMPDSRLIDGWLAMWSEDSGIKNLKREKLGDSGGD